ncbi:hypothetical protein [Streptomyces sp. NPDC002785]|uniref:hypothetical protein n=1 Tax=Streptomyces sp. NPDC002785 TaxID=3154543 RepID=UPI0033291586
MDMGTRQRMLFTSLSEVAILRALEVAGNRLKKNDRPSRAAVNHLPKWDVHTFLPAKEANLDSLLKGSWDIPRASGYPDRLLQALDEHARIILTAGIAYSRADLLMTLSKYDLDAMIFYEKNGG